MHFIRLYLQHGVQRNITYSESIIIVNWIESDCIAIITNYHRHQNLCECRYYDRRCVAIQCKSKFGYPVSIYFSRVNLTFVIVQYFYHQLQQYESR